MSFLSTLFSCSSRGKEEPCGLDDTTEISSNTHKGRTYKHTQKSEVTHSVTKIKSALQDKNGQAEAGTKWISGTEYADRLAKGSNLLLEAAQHHEKAAQHKAHAEKYGADADAMLASARARRLAAQQDAK